MLRITGKLSIQILYCDSGVDVKENLYDKK